MDHTKEPWKIGNGRKTDLYMGWDTILGKNEDGEKFVLCRVNGNYEDIGRANARRIVACVNACAGIPNDMLEEAGFGNVLSIGVTNLTAERDSLRSTLAEKTAQVERLRDALTNIYDYGLDRDGEYEAERLGELVDELVKLAREALAATALKDPK